MFVTAPVYDAAATRAIERSAIEDQGLPGLDLMRRAGQGAFVQLQRHWPDVRRVAVISGVGNNGGDGFVVARLAKLAGLEVDLYVVGDSAGIKNDALATRAEARASGVIERSLPNALHDADVVVDALFGSGLNRVVDGIQAEAIDLMNSANAARMALDIPSGLHADSGAILGCAVDADITISFITCKQGLLSGAAPDCVGELVVDDLGVPPSCFDVAPVSARLLDYDGVRDHLRCRPRTSHKGDFGHVLVVGGAPGFAGAARLSAEAAARCGAGLVSVATHPSQAGAITTTRPEVMSHAIADATALRALMSRASVLAIGPGLGQSTWARDLFACARSSALTQICDADGLNLLAADPDACEHRILTPHPGEAARLLQTSTREINADRFASVRQLSERYGGIALLKGAGTLLHAQGEVPVIVGGGNPGMATGGMGDVLTGLIAGLVAQHIPPLEAAVMGAAIHARAGDDAADEGGERGMLAMDLLEQIRRLMNPDRGAQ